MKQNTPPLVLRSEMRTDSVPVDEHYSAEGYFYDNPILTRTGIFKYTLEDGSERRELRRPEDVFDPESLASYEGKPIIITHDAQVIDKDNAHRERVGTILTPGQQDGETVRAKIVIDDPDAVKASGLRELSVGYYQDLIMEPGEWNGEPYDAIQTHIRVNHLALVAVARAGDDARLNMDSQDISKAEKEFVGTKLGEARLAVVVSWLREKVPAPIRFLVTDDLIRKAVQTSFNAAKSGLEVLKNA